VNIPTIPIKASNQAATSQKIAVDEIWSKCLIAGFLVVAQFGNVAASLARHMASK
jgi:hypothetical protein